MSTKRDPDATRYWVVVASAEHVALGVEGGFVQAGHGREGPVARLTKGDWIAAYSPREAMRGGDPVQAFTAIGRVDDEKPRAVSRGPLGTHYRRTMKWRKHAQRAPAKPLIDRLGFIKNRQSWGIAFRRGLFEIEQEDFAAIAGAMGVKMY